MKREEMRCPTCLKFDGKRCRANPTPWNFEVVQEREEFDPQEHDYKRWFEVEEIDPVTFWCGQGEWAGLDSEGIPTVFMWGGWDDEEGDVNLSEKAAVFDLVKDLRAIVWAAEQVLRESGPGSPLLSPAQSALQAAIYEYRTIGAPKYRLVHPDEYLPEGQTP